MSQLLLFLTFIACVSGVALPGCRLFTEPNYSQTQICDAIVTPEMIYKTDLYTRQNVRVTYQLTFNTDEDLPDHYVKPYVNMMPSLQKIDIIKRQACCEKNDYVIYINNENSTSDLPGNWTTECKDEIKVKCRSAKKCCPPPVIFGSIKVSVEPVTPAPKPGSLDAIVMKMRIQIRQLENLVQRISSMPKPIAA